MLSVFLFSFQLFIDKATNIPITTRTILPITYILSSFVFLLKFVTYFSIEFYHWLLIGHHEAQRFCVWLVVCLIIKLVKETEPEENPWGFSSTHRPIN